MTRTQRRSSLVPNLAWTLGLLLLGVGPIAGTELEVHRSRHKEGAYSVKKTDGGFVEFVISQRGPTDRKKPDGPGDCVESDWPRDGYELIVSRRTGRRPEDLEIIPMQTPLEVTEVKVAEVGSSVLLAIRGEYMCYHHRGEYSKTDWFIVEIDPVIELRRNSSFGRGSGECFPGDVNRAQPSITPRFETRSGELWFNIPLGSFVCFNGGENRGWYEWPVGLAPAPIEDDQFEGLERLVGEVRELGFQPYQKVEFGHGLTGLWAEIPSNHGAPRVLGLTHVSGAEGAILLPRFGFLSGHRWFVDNSTEFGDLPRQTVLPTHLREDWPEISEISSFHWSKQFLEARKQQSSRFLIEEGAVKIFELEMPCIEDAYPAPNENLTERWVLRSEVSGVDIHLHAALLNPCAEHFIFGVPTVGFPEYQLDVAEQEVRIRYGRPSVGIEELAESKFLFDQLDSVSELFSFDEVVMRVDAAPALAARSEVPVPTSGPGWSYVRFPYCDLRVRHLDGEGFSYYGKRDGEPPRFIDPPEPIPQCQRPGAIEGTCNFRARISNEGRVIDFESVRCAGEHGAETALELQSSIEKWNFSPAKDAGGESTSGTLSIYLIPIDR